MSRQEIEDGQFLVDLSDAAAEVADRLSDEHKHMASWAFRQLEAACQLCAWLFDTGAWKITCVHRMTTFAEVTPEEIEAMHNEPPKPRHLKIVEEGDVAEASGEAAKAGGAQGAQEEGRLGGEAAGEAGAVPGEGPDHRGP